MGWGSHLNVNLSVLNASQVRDVADRRWKDPCNELISASHRQHQVTFSPHTAHHLIEGGGGDRLTLGICTI